jgi:hypothetical protein
MASQRALVHAQDSKKETSFQFRRAEYDSLFLSKKYMVILNKLEGMNSQTKKVKYFFYLLAK